MAEILLEFESGAIGNVHVDYLQREPSRTLRLIGEEGTIHWDALKPEATLLDHRSGNREVFQGETDERKRSFEIEMEHFLECIEGKAEPAVDLDAGIEALRLAVAAKRAAERGEVINMDDIQP